MDLTMSRLFIWQYFQTYPMNRQMKITAVSDDPAIADTEMVAASDPRSDA
jgi:hypothetical protein